MPTPLGPVERNATLYSRFLQLFVRDENTGLAKKNPVFPKRVWEGVCPAAMDSLPNQVLQT